VLYCAKFYLDVYSYPLQCEDGCRWVLLAGGQYMGSGGQKSPSGSRGKAPLRA